MCPWDRIRPRFVRLYVRMRGYLNGRDIIGESESTSKLSQDVWTAEGRVDNECRHLILSPLFTTIYTPHYARILGVQAPLSLRGWRICAIGQRELTWPLDTLGAFSTARSGVSGRLHKEKGPQFAAGYLRYTSSTTKAQFLLAISLRVGMEVCMEVGIGRTLQFTGYSLIRWPCCKG